VKKIKVGIIGANGYTGYELLKILAGHDGVEVAHAVSRSNAGASVGALYPALAAAYPCLKFSDADTDKAAKDCTLVFTALPHAAAAETGGKLYDKGVTVIDLSADFRYDDIPLYERTYNVTHPRPKLNAKAVYGLTEINRAQITALKGTPAIIGNPGCYTTSCILPLYPLLKAGLLEPHGIVIDAKSGASGAGRRAEADFGFCEIEGNFKAYGVAVHRHTSEMEEKLSLGQKDFKLCFVPHLLPVKRGILSTVYTDVKPKVSADSIADCLTAAYGKEKFVEVLPEGSYPTLNRVTGSNVCSIGFKFDARTGKVIIISCLDNLIKGASGQAVQNMNILLGFDESKGLSVTGNHL